MRRGTGLHGVGEPIVGTVADEERRPIPGADVKVDGVGLAKTDDAGAFTFNGVPPGERVVLTAKVGYEQEAKRVVVAPGEIAEVHFVLKAILIPDVYHESFTKTGVVSGQYTVNYLQNTINNTVLDNLMCGPCQWVVEFKPGIVDAVSDMLFKRAVSAPGLNEVIILLYNKNLNQGELIGTMMSHEFEPRESYHWTQNQVRGLKGVPKARLQLHGPDPDKPGIAFQQRVDLWQTWAFGELLPEDFSLLPPP
ncbi:MAG: carboxypeptidase regulatory-like domain-containing protein [Euryarchaeota archaeon]|nr:carboxypeptidase regulatory-like domain-containing protein [Euryarchaeota archaeon]